MALLVSWYQRISSTDSLTINLFYFYVLYYFLRLTSSRHFLHCSLGSLRSTYYTSIHLVRMKTKYFSFMMGVSIRSVSLSFISSLRIVCSRRSVILYTLHKLGYKGKLSYANADDVNSPNFLHYQLTNQYDSLRNTLHGLYLIYLESRHISSVIYYTIYYVQLILQL